MKYQVIVTRAASESAVIDVEADSKEAAAIAAMDRARSEAVGWELNDDYAPDVFLAGDLEDDVTEEGEDAVIR